MCGRNRCPNKRVRTLRNFQTKVTMGSRNAPEHPPRYSRPEKSLQRMLCTHWHRSPAESPLPGSCCENPRPFCSRLASPSPKPLNPKRRLQMNHYGLRCAHAVASCRSVMSRTLALIFRLHISLFASRPAGYRTGTSKTSDFRGSVDFFCFVVFWHSRSTVACVAGRIRVPRN